MNPWIISLVVMLAYLVIALYIGMLAGKGRDASLEEYVTGKRKFGIVVVLFLTAGTWFSSFLFLGGPGWAYSKGGALMFITAYVMPPFILWYWIGPKVSRIGAKLKLLTQGDFLKERYKSRALPVIVGFISMIAFIQYICVQLKGTAYLFNVFTAGNIPMWLGALIAYGIVVIYVTSSGVRGAAWSDVLQGIIMIVVAWGIGMYLVYHLYDGPVNMFNAISKAKPGHLLIGKEGSHMGGATFSSLIILSSIGGMMWPHLFMKAYVTDGRTIKKSILLFPIIAIFIIPVFFIGFAGILKVTPDVLGAGDRILPYLIYNVVKVSPFIIGIVGAGALAASMSSADAITHGAGTVFVQDIMHNIKMDIPEKRLLLYMRIAICVVGAIAYLLTFLSQTLVGLLIGGYGFIVQIAPLIYGGLFWGRATKEGAISGFVAGTAINIFFVFSHLPTPFGINSGLLGLMVNIVFFVVVSYLTKPQSGEHVKQFLDE